MSGSLPIDISIASSQGDTALILTSFRESPIAVRAEADSLWSSVSHHNRACV